jgi:hypothetical protein
MQVNKYAHRTKKKIANTFAEFFCVSTFFHYLIMYQSRYNAKKFDFTVTWEHIGYWRHHVNVFGWSLVERKYLSKSDFLQLKRFVEKPYGWEAVKENMPLTVKDREANAALG